MNLSGACRCQKFPQDDLELIRTHERIDMQEDLRGR